MENTNKPLEIWKDIPGYEGYYQASNLGNIKSLERFAVHKNGNSHLVKEKIFKPQLVRGYFKVTFCRDSKFKNYQVHKLVVGHINNIKTDNRLENLQIITARENQTKDRKVKTSSFIGVHWCKNHKRFIANFSVKSYQVSLGSFLSEKEASDAYQTALYNYNTFGIFPKKRIKSSKYKGVSYIKKRNRWSSSVYVDGKTKRIGNFKTEIEAYNARQHFLTINQRIQYAREQ